MHYAGYTEQKSLLLNRQTFVLLENQMSVFINTRAVGLQRIFLAFIALCFLSTSLFAIYLAQHGLHVSSVGHINIIRAEELFKAPDEGQPPSQGAAAGASSS